MKIPPNTTVIRETMQASATQPVTVMVLPRVRAYGSTSTDSKPAAFCKDATWRDVGDGVRAYGVFRNQEIRRDRFLI